MIRDIKKTFLSTQVYFYIAVGLTLLIFFLELGPIILSRLGEDTGTEDVSKGLIGLALGYISNTPRAADFMNVLVWGGLGLLVYSLYYFIQNIRVVAYNEIQLAAYHKQKGISPRIVQARARNKILGIIGYSAVLLFSLVVLLRFWVWIMRSGVTSDTISLMIPLPTLGVVLMTLNIYLLIIGGIILWKYVNASDRYY